MTLEEAIDHAREKACGTDACADDHRQLAAWLEELRDTRARLGKRPWHWPAGESISACEIVKTWARDMVMRFGRPVYLVGSALQVPSPRDVDVRIVLSTEEFESRWGRYAVWGSVKDPLGGDGWRRYAADMGKLGREASKRCCLNIDLQVQPLGVAGAYAKEPRVRLDDVLDIEDAE